MLAGRDCAKIPAWLLLSRQQFADTQPGLGATTQSGQHRCLQAEGTMLGSKRRFLPKSRLLGGSAACSQGKVALGLTGTCQPGGPPARSRVGDAAKRPRPVTLSPIKLEAERDPRRGRRIIYLTFLLRCPLPPLWAAVPPPSPEDAGGSRGRPRAFPAGQQSGLLG